VKLHVEIARREQAKRSQLKLQKFTSRSQIAYAREIPRRIRRGRSKREEEERDEES
jgi:hypothetical protein